jgi:hypothetical protein
MNIFIFIGTTVKECTKLRMVLFFRTTASSSMEKFSGRLSIKIDWMNVILFLFRGNCLFLRFASP